MGGAPGMVTALASLPVGVNEPFDHILAQGGELTWQAGPLRKGSNLCQGGGGGRHGRQWLCFFSSCLGERAMSCGWIEPVPLPWPPLSNT